MIETGRNGEEFLTLYIGWGLAFAVISALIWWNKGGSAIVGFIIGSLLNLLGVILVAVMTPKAVPNARQKAAISRECPHCKEQMRRDASVCPHCRRDSNAWTFHDGWWWATNTDGETYYLDERANEWVRWEQAPSPAPQA